MLALVYMNAEKGRGYMLDNFHKSLRDVVDQLYQRIEIIKHGVFSKVYQI